MKRLFKHLAKILGWSVACFAIFYIALILYLQWDFRKRPSQAAEITYQVCMRIADAYYAPPKYLANRYKTVSGHKELAGLGTPEAWLIPWTVFLGATLHGLGALRRRITRNRSSQQPPA